MGSKLNKIQHTFIHQRMTCILSQNPNLEQSDLILQLSHEEFQNLLTILNMRFSTLLV